MASTRIQGAPPSSTRPPAACSASAEQVIGKSIHRSTTTTPTASPTPPSHCPTNQTLRNGNVVTITDEGYALARRRPSDPGDLFHPPDDPRRAIVGAVVNFMDVTERRALEEARVSKLPPDRRASGQGQERVLANMSHEIRTRFNGVLGFARIGYRVRDHPHDPGWGVFANILDSANCCWACVNDILDFSKIEATANASSKGGLGRPPPPHAASTPSRPSASETEARQPQSPSRTPELPAVCRSDPLRPARSSANLLSNALSSTEHGPGVPRRPA